MAKIPKKTDSYKIILASSDSFTTQWLQGKPMVMNEYYYTMTHFPGGIKPKKRILFWDGTEWSLPDSSEIVAYRDVYMFAQLIPVECARFI